MNYVAPPTHTLNEKEKEFLKSLTPKEYALHEIAIKKLGSSYFVWKTHAFQEWLSKQK